MDTNWHVQLRYLQINPAYIGCSRYSSISLVGPLVNSLKHPYQNLQRLFFVPLVMAMTHFHITGIANARQLLGSSGIGGLLLLK